MIATEYAINPVMMMGTIKDIQDDFVTLHLRGRLAVITLEKKHFQTNGPLVVGAKVQFYFSYIQVIDTLYDYDESIWNQDYELSPSLLQGTICHVDDTSVQVDMAGEVGRIIVPRRWVFTHKTLETRQHVAFYFSYVTVIQ